VHVSYTNPTYNKRVWNDSILVIKAHSNKSHGIGEHEQRRRTSMLSARNSEELATLLHLLHLE
jgi:hypothetical protein